MTERLHFQFSLSCIGEGKGTPLQCSCLENPRDGGAWGAAVYGVAQSRTRLKRLSSSSSRSGDADRTDLRTRGGREEEKVGGTERGTRKPKSPSVTQIADGNLRDDSGSSNRGSGTT